jgi:PEP-CTERM motif
VTDAYVHVQSISTGGVCGDCSAKYTPLTPVPEPQTYAMLQAGLGLVGFSARRKMNNNA